VPLFDANTQQFQGAGMTLYVQNGQGNAGGARLTFAPLTQSVDNLQSAAPQFQNLFVGIANNDLVPDSIIIYNDTTGNPPQLSDPQVVNEGSTAALVGFTGAGSALCANCDFLKWGAWAAVLNFENQSQTATNHVNALGFWVAGDIVVDSVGALPTTGGANYAGTAWGSVVTDLFDGQQTYPASGDMTMHWDFGTRTGQFDVTKFDTLNFPDGGISFGGPLKAPGVPTGQLNQFSGQLTGMLPNQPAWQDVNLALTGGVTGSFVKGPSQVAGDIPAAAIGNWAITNGAQYSNYYNASGIFAGSHVAPH
jgi:hypothetical protein